jgi:hypothetical protein
LIKTERDPVNKDDDDNSPTLLHHIPYLNKNLFYYIGGHSIPSN